MPSATCHFHFRISELCTLHQSGLRPHQRGFPTLAPVHMATCVVCQAAAFVYCHNDQAFLCAGCDSSIHSSNALAARHCRVKVCELCHKKQSTVFCKNDQAFLCDYCDADIHLNNPLGARHELVPAIQAVQEMVGFVSTYLCHPADLRPNSKIDRSCGCCRVAVEFL